jgi:hypothetical protein
VGDARLVALSKELEERLGLSRTPAAAAPLADDSPAVAPAPNGNGGLERSGLIRTLTTARIREATAVADSGPDLSRPVPVLVRALHEVDDVSDAARHVLLVVEPELPPHSELHRVRNLVATTGWQVIGVVGWPARGRVRAATRAERE